MSTVVYNASILKAIIRLTVAGDEDAIATMALGLNQLLDVMVEIETSTQRTPFMDRVVRKAVEIRLQS